MGSRQFKNKSGITLSVAGTRGRQRGEGPAATPQGQLLFPSRDTLYILDRLVFQGSCSLFWGRIPPLGNACAHILPLVATTPQGTCLLFRLSVGGPWL